MGYAIITNCAEFEIKQENFPELIKLARRNCKSFGVKSDYLSDDLNVLTSEQFLRNLFDTVGIVIDFFDHNICSATCNDKLVRQEQFLTAIAPAVEPDCFIELSGEDGTLWRWVFKHKKLHSIQPKWPEVTEMQP